MNVKPEPLSMKEAEAFWQEKKILSPKAFYVLAEVSRGRAFTVSDLATRDCIDTVYASMQKAIKEGVSYGEWKRSLMHVWDKAGWVSEKGKLLNHRRVNTIFRTNIQTAYQSGRFEQMKRVSQKRPYWQYEAVGDKRTRPTHWALHGKIFPSDHDFWDTFYPPNGFNCRCTVNTLSERQAKGETIEKDNPYGTLIEPIDPRTGGKMPARLLMPDRGFEGHPKLGMDNVVSEKDWDMPGLKEDAERRKKEEAERRKKEEAERRKKEEAKRRKKEEAERRQKEEAETEKPKRMETPRVSAENFEKSYDKIVAERGSGAKGFVRIHDMRDELGWSTDEFDRMLEKLAKDKKIVLHHGDHTMLTKEQWKKSYLDPEKGIPFMTISWVEKKQEDFFAKAHGMKKYLTKKEDIFYFERMFLNDVNNAGGIEKWVDNVEKTRKNRKREFLKWDHEENYTHRKNLEAELSYAAMFMNDGLVEALAKNPINTRIKDIERSSYKTAKKEIHLAKSAKPKSVLHEMGHHIEIVTNSKKHSQEWRNSRAKKEGEKYVIKRLKDIEPEKKYKGHEKVVVDNFSDPYIGRLYKGGITEVLSMGLQELGSRERLIEYYQKDSSHLAYAIGVLSGAIK